MEKLTAMQNYVKKKNVSVSAYKLAITIYIDEVPPLGDLFTLCSLCVVILL